MANNIISRILGLWLSRKNASTDFVTLGGRGLRPLRKMSSYLQIISNYLCHDVVNP